MAMRWAAAGFLEAEKAFRRLPAHKNNPALIRTVDAQGIRLSPAYDLNPSIEQRDLSLAINEVETACDVFIAIDACRDYGVSKQAANGVLKQVRGAISG